MTIYLVSLISIVILIINLILLHKAKRIHILLFESKQQHINESNNLYKQLEALTGLYTTLPIIQALPPLRGWAGSPDYLLELAQRTLKKKPNVVVECGSGSSSLVIGACLKKLNQGHCFSLDHNKSFAQQTRNTIAAHGLTEWVTILDSPLISQQINGKKHSWYDLSKLSVEKIDLLNIDDPPMNSSLLARYPAIPLLNSLLQKNSLVLLDDAGRSDEKEIVKRWEEEFTIIENKYINTEKGLTILTLE